MTRLCRKAARDWLQSVQDQGGGIIEPRIDGRDVRGVPRQHDKPGLVCERVDACTIGRGGTVGSGARPAKRLGAVPQADGNTRRLPRHAHQPQE